MIHAGQWHVRSDGWCREKPSCDPSGSLPTCCRNGQPEYMSDYVEPSPCLLDLRWACNVNTKDTVVALSHWGFTVAPTALVCPILIQIPFPKCTFHNISSWRSPEEMISVSKQIFRKVSALWNSPHSLAYQRFCKVLQKRYPLKFV